MKANLLRSRLSDVVYPLLTLIALSLMPAQTRAQIKVCNHTTVEINSVVVYLENDTWKTSGWYRVEPSECIPVTNNLSNRFFYLHAEDSGGSRQWGSSDHWYCVDPRNAFEILSDNTCAQENKRQFDELVIDADAEGANWEVTCNDCPAPTGKPEWQRHLDWSIHNHDAGGSTDCPLDYRYPGCVINGGRACLMTHAIESAHAHDCANAFRLALITQCHNSEAAQTIQAAGQNEVCNYLGPPNPSPPPDPTPVPQPSPSPTRPAHPVTFVNQSGMNLYLYYAIGFGGTVDCRNYAVGGMQSPQGQWNITIPADASGHFVFQRQQNPCPVSTIHWEVNLYSGNPNRQTVSVP
jgi:uncharacterized membrane protein